MGAPHPWNSMPLYPEIEPFHCAHMDVGDGHSVYVEQVGNPRGEPVVVLHGGPGGGCNPSYRRYFDPARYRVVLFDQRGAGRSTPNASVEHNTTWDLVDDIERIRTHLGIDSWVVFGGSWGSTLALAYAITHPARARALMLRGIFLARVHEYAWLYGPEGVARIFPERYAAFLAPIPFAERHEILAAYHRRLMGSDQAVAERCALAWSVWEGAISRLLPQEDVEDVMGPIALAFARIECHYFIHGCWLSPNQLLEGARATLQDIPVVIAQGRYDVICPVSSAYELAQVLPHAELHIAPSSGHSVSEPEITEILLHAMDAL